MGANNADFQTIQGIAAATRNAEVEKEKQRWETPEGKKHMEVMERISGGKRDWDAEKKQPLFKSFDEMKQDYDDAKEWSKKKVSELASTPEGREIISRAQFWSIIKRNFPNG